jgi:hemolysin activation/secretion protein
LSPGPVISEGSRRFLQARARSLRTLKLIKAICALLIGWSLGGFAPPASAAANSSTNTPPPNVPSLTNAPTFVVTNYQLKGDTLLPQEIQASLFSKYTGTNVALSDIVKAASDLLLEYRNRGYTTVGVAIAQDRITNGIVTLNVFRSRLPQILVSGKRYSTNGEPAFASQPPAAAGTNAPNSEASTNATPKFVVAHYEVRGDTILSTETLTSILTNYIGTNITVGDVIKAASELQLEYRNRGFPTVNVTLPPQQITNGIVKIRVFVGRLSDIVVTGNHWHHFFSSNNVMRALPSLETNIVLNSPIFQAELDRANASQDRQIYPQIEPGDIENTTRLRLEVRDRLPLHGKLELNDQSSPGTPELRINSSLVYNNLWQFEHSLGVQYSFSPENYKKGNLWDLYDRPQVANYSGFYRIPLANPESVSEAIATGPGNFGYDEATRKFRLPPSSGKAELNIFASRSVIDTGVLNLSHKTIQNIPGVLSIVEDDVQQDLTVNNDLGARLSLPFAPIGIFQSTVSAGLDYKSYHLNSAKTNNFLFSIITLDVNGNPNPPVTSTVSSPVPTTARDLDYMPVSIRWDGNERDNYGATSLGLGSSANFWFSGTTSNLQGITGSSRSTGRWMAFAASAAREQLVYTNCPLALRLDGQVASEPLISSEQFGNGGVAGVRGYREGEVFGDSGWRITTEQKTPPLVIGLAYGKTPLTVRGSFFMDYGETYLLDAGRRKDRQALWGAGFGGAASIGANWEARFLFSWPLIRTATTQPGEPRFDFSLSAQF